MQSKALSAIHAAALEENRAIQSAVRDERRQCAEDRRFATIAGAMWEGPFGEQFADKPKLEVNKAHLSVMRLINEYRNNRITVDFVSKDGDEDDDIADICDGLYRADEDDSVADEAYDNAFEEAVTGGMGAWRLRADYEDDEDEEDDRQRILIEPIYDADTSVFFDLGAKRQDKSDAKHCFVLSSMTVDAFKEEWDRDPTTWPKEINDINFDWFGPDFVYVAEYYKVVEGKAEISVYEHLDGSEEKFTDITEEQRAELAARGATHVRTKQVKKRKVHKYLMCGDCILEDCGIIAGRHIPIIPVYGKRWYVDNIERCMGHVRLSKDALRLKNMLLSKLAEQAAFGSIETPIFTPEQVAGHEASWQERNVRNPAYLLLNPIEDKDGNEVPTGPLGYTQAPTVPQTTAALLAIIEEDLQALLGNQEAGEEVPNEISGKAIELIQSRLDMQAYIYMSNMAKAVRRCGEVWLSMAGDVYVEEGRRMKSVGAQGGVESVIVRQPSLDPKTGEVVHANDLSKARLDVTVDVGPSSASKRTATVRGLMGMMQVTQDPETLQVLNFMAMMNMEGEGLGETRAFFRQKLVAMGAVKPTDKEQAELDAAAQNQKPDPQAAYLMAEAQRAAALTDKAVADTRLAEAKTEATYADAADTLAGITPKQRESAAKAAKDLRAASAETATRPAG